MRGHLVGVPADGDLPGEAAEGLWQRLETVSLNYQDLELHQGLDVLSQVVQAVTGQVQEHLRRTQPMFGWGGRVLLMHLPELSCCRHNRGRER